MKSKSKSIYVFASLINFFLAYAIEEETKVAHATAEKMQEILQSTEEDQLV